jgi:hypothetical protein
MVIGMKSAAVLLVSTTVASLIAIGLAAYFFAKDRRRQTTRRLVFAAAIVMLTATPLAAQIYYDCEKGCWWCIECWFAADPTTVDWEVQQTFNSF